MDNRNILTDGMMIYKLLARRLNSHFLDHLDDGFLEVVGEERIFLGRGEIWVTLKNIASIERFPEANLYFGEADAP